jgi:hypothetical protein
MKSIFVLPFALALSLSAHATSYSDFKDVQHFLIGTSDWGKSAKGDCRFDFSLEPVVDGVHGVSAQESLAVAVNLDRAPDGRGEFSDLIGATGVSVRSIKSGQIEISGGSYNGDATLILTKQADGSVLLKAHWIDRELGPDRDGYCKLPAL